MKKKEVFITLLIITVAMISLLLFHYAYKDRSTIVVRNADGEILLSVPLDEDGYYSLEGKEGIFNLEVKDGSYRATDVECPNHDCEEVGWVNADSYRPIICLPNGIAVELIR
ncbi:MAG: NusG domain II-containing protein [Erysipelotrichaceae bacterium]|nr:NusG domain II-containing protein [Erysipelotrichaceae bacterium]